jgi:uncharacterized membrane protein YbhN (UPF0104 family)
LAREPLGLTTLGDGPTPLSIQTYLWMAFYAIHASPVPNFAVVLMALIIGALGGSIPLPGNIGAIGGIAAMLVLYGVAHNAAVAAVLLYEAIGLLVPLTGGGIGYLLLRRQFGPMQTVPEPTADTHR